MASKRFEVRGKTLYVFSGDREKSFAVRQIHTTIMRRASLFRKGYLTIKVNGSFETVTFDVFEQPYHDMIREHIEKSRENGSDGNWQGRP